MDRVAQAAFAGHFGHRQVGGGEKFLRRLEAHTEDFFLRASAQVLLKLGAWSGQNTLGQWGIDTSGTGGYVWTGHEFRGAPGISSATTDGDGLELQLDAGVFSFLADLSDTKP